MLPEAPVLHGDERVDHITVDLIVRHPLRVAAVRGSRRTKRQAITILDPHTVAARGACDDRCGQWRHDPRRDTAGDDNQQQTASNKNALHCCRAVTTKVPPSLLPYTAGLYISSACSSFSSWPSSGTAAAPFTPGPGMAEAVRRLRSTASRPAGSASSNTTNVRLVGTVRRRRTRTRSPSATLVVGVPLSKRSYQ